MSALENLREPLLLEAQLSASCVAAGLTSLRRFNFTDKGSFYSGLVSFSVGLERLLKLSLLLESFSTRGRTLTQAELMAFSHNLVSLFAAARSINTSRALGIATASVDDPIVTDALACVSEFARTTRYHNLNVAVGSAAASTVEPLRKWAQLVVPQLLKRHYRPSQRARGNAVEARRLGSLSGIVVEHTALDGSLIQDIENLEVHAATLDATQKYSVFYLHRLVEFGIDLLEALDRTPLYLAEPFRSMSAVPRRMVLSRKKWEPYL